MKPIEELGLSPRCLGVLWRHGVRYIDQVIFVRDAWLMRLKGIGEASVMELRGRIIKYLNDLW